MESLEPKTDVNNQSKPERDLSKYPRYSNRLSNSSLQMFHIVYKYLNCQVAIKKD